MKVRKIPISKLKPGMYVSKLDISWLKSPFMTHHRLIESDKDIVLLRQSGVKQVTIDIDKGLDIVSVANPGQIPTKANPTEPEAAPPAAIKMAEEKVSLDKELQVARAIQNKLAAVTQVMFESLQSNEPISTEALSPLIDQTLDSLHRNEQALISLMHMRRKAENLFDHCSGVFSLALGLGMRLDLTAEQQQELGLAALLHDVGWLKLPLHLFGKGRSYSKQEAALVQQHSLLGYAMLKKSPGTSATVLQVIQQHHEVDNGQGYPKGLSKDQLHPLSQILAVADHYDELIHEILDQPGMLPTNALRELFIQARNGRYDEAIVSQLVSLTGVYPIGTAVQLNTGEKALVEEICPHHTNLPKIKIFYDRQGAPRAKPLNLNLAKQSGDIDRQIKQAIDPDHPGMDPAKLLAWSQ